MELVVDANILVAGFLRAALTRELLLDERLTLSIPEYTLTEARHVLTRPGFQRRVGHLPSEKILDILDLLTTRITVQPQSAYHDKMAKALTLAPHPEDAPTLALALKRHVPIWSNDAGLKQQGEVRVYTTHELLQLL